ncbi:Peptidoglycan/LPS O-acetylase OafA/YrhL, contains acyltransferase and SGNH-hydrolase domains [Pseudomonas mucidolens]|uniref:Peptidoglycan/LPS O-acetylase OafA/YrhL, contains acyltransferase and SGNH-hydrolase domains n=2 Tax=Pseudomonas mucidolens TaxID=46679 RepID=A0A1H2N1X6_9PSED|nr:Peptidoglycan/LPS O-acetylase OafA/YrhL, contains acyltransferase and SGNH-hydrolase domains [Pseudomonas mucidolens]SQH32799.1 acyltransferase 3 [Pseudomonas mucidolens]
MIALLSTNLIVNKLVAPSAHGRFVTIDGLRGYLAFFVFLHHSCIWYYYLQSGVWALPPSRLFVHFGQIGVALFFMITGFLFFNKLLESRGRKVDWLRLYISRFLRLTPLYLFSMALLFLIVWVLTRDGLVQPIDEILIGGLKWIGFRVVGAPDLNGLLGTRYISAGVTWTLPYEWFFYLFLPVIALAIGLRPPFRYLFLAVLAVYVFEVYGYRYDFGWLFLGGMGAAFLVRYDRFNAFAVSRLATCIIVGVIVFVVTRYPTIYVGFEPKLLLMIVFCLIAGGNSIFGLLKLKVSRAMGEMAYSIYLLHGILLFVIFKFVLGSVSASQLTFLQYWGVIVLATPVLIFVCALTFRFIERPAMRSVDTLTGLIRAKKKNSLESAR